ncbi:MAG: hypothetical protein AAGF07_04975 [Patescibacteria group bacterium]
MLDNSKTGVTIVIKRLVKYKHQKKYKELLSESYLASIKFEGFLGLDVFNDQKTEYITFVYRFNTEENLNKWLESEEAKVYSQKMNKISSDTELKKLSGLEYWFNYSSDSGLQPPKKSKMIVATVMGVYPLQLLVTSPLLGFLEESFPQIPYFVLLLCISLFSISTLTYIVMPKVTKILKFWLYPKIDTEN